MSSGQGSTPAGRSAAEKGTAKANSPEGSDSGYGSTANTTDGSTIDHSQDFADGIAVRHRTFFERRVTKLRLFDREIPKSTQDRFHDLHELFERPLCDHLNEAKINPYPISLKLKCWGESEATAKPCIVVLCNKTVSKRVRQFFNQQHIRAAYQPSNPDSSLPSFDICYFNRPPRSMAGPEIYGDLDERSTMCGRVIKVGEAHESRFATLGGVIRLVKPSGTVSLYGMTAGHILAQQPLEQYGFDHVDIHNEGDEEDEGYDSGVEEYELGDTFEGDEEAQDLAITGNTTRPFSQNAQLGRLWPKIGSVFAASNEGTITGQDHDWALIEFVRVADYLPNLLVPFNGEERTAKHRPLKENRKSAEDGSSRKVFLLSGTGGVKSGTLSTSLSFLMMGPAKAFAKTYTLVLPHDSVLNAGDCGSWVVDESTCEVYGHVVASDAMCDTYVVPLNATLRDMENKLGAAVSLPTEADIHKWLSQQTKAVAEQITVPAGNKKKRVAFNDSKKDKVKYPEDLQELTGNFSSQASTPLAPSTKSSTPIADYCSSCNARFEGPSQGVRSELLRHRRSCSKQNEHTALGVDSPTARDAKDSFDKGSKSSSVKHSKSVQQTIRSMYSKFMQNPGSGSQQKDKSKVKSVRISKEDKLVRSASSTQPAETTSPTSTAEDLRKDTKKSHSKRNSAPPSIIKELPAASSAVAGRIKGELSSTPTTGPRPSPPTTPPVLSGLPEYGRFSVTPPPRRAPSPIRRHESFHGSTLDFDPQSHNNNPGQVTYEGYTFTKYSSPHARQKETWAVARMVPMPVSQQDLKDQIKRNRKKYVSALDEYNDEKMKGFKRKQVDNLIRERTKVDGDYGYEYILASIKLDSRKTKGKITETVSMQVILKRQLIAGLPHETSAEPSTDFHAKLPSQVMDLTSVDELGMSKHHGGGSQDVSPTGANVPFAGYPGHGAFPTFVGPSQPFSQGLRQFDNGILPLHAAPHPLEPIHSPAQGMRQPLDPHSGSLVRRNTHDPQRDLRKVDKSNPKNKASKVVHLRRESQIGHDYASSSSSLSDDSAERDSDNSWAKTDATPDTVFSGQSRKQRIEERHRKEGKEKSRNKGRSEPTSSAHDLAIGDPSDAVDIPRSIECCFNITVDGAKASAAANSLAIDYTESNSYQSVEKAAQDIAQDHVRASSTGILVPRQFNFKYGTCTIIGDHVEKIGLPLTTREDWESVCTILVNYWRSDPLRTLHVDIWRDYFSYRSRAASEVSLAATKRREMHNLIKYPLGNEPYIPRTALMRFNSLQNIREIICQDNHLDMEPEDKEHLIKTVQSSAPCLLALCVYAGLKMECLNLFLQRGFSDAALPTQIKDCCHDKCAPNFSTLLRMRGGFVPARFDKVGEHQDFHHTVVIPIHFVPVEEDQDEIMRAGRQRDLEEGRGSTTSVTDDAKQSACCGLGAYSNVYRVRIDPDHHRLSKDKNVDFALKEFRDRPNRGDHDFQRELKILDELRKYPLRHIVTHLATWTHQGRYYMLFPYAQCNLRQYMKWVQFGAPTKEKIIWLIRRFRGLAEALKGIHDLSGAGPLQSTPDLITRPVGERRAGYHHDLKPENILFYGATGDFKISDFGSGKVHAYRSGSHNTPSHHGTLTYEPPEAAGAGGTSRPYDMWSLGCVFLELLTWAVLGFPAIEEFRQKRLDRRFPGSFTATHEDDAFWQMLPNRDVTLRKAVVDFTKALREAILQQRNQPFKEILDLVIKMLDTVKETRIPALDLYDTLDRIYNQKKIDLENVGDGSLPDSNDGQEGSPSLLRLSMDPPDRRSSERAREGGTTAVRNAGNITGDFLTASSINSASPHSPRGFHRRNSSASEFVGLSRNASIASSNMSTHGRCGSIDEHHG